MFETKTLFVLRSMLRVEDVLKIFGSYITTYKSNNCRYYLGTVRSFSDPGAGRV